MKRIPLIALAILLPLPLTAADSELTLKVGGLACPFCVNGVERQLRRLSGVGGLTTELKTGSVSFHWQGTNSLSAHSLSNAVRRAGFTLRESQVRAQGLVKKTGSRETPSHLAFQPAKRVVQSAGPFWKRPPADGGWR